MRPLLTALIIATLFSAFTALSSARAKDLGVVGATYSIAETDALTEIENRLKGGYGEMPNRLSAEG